MSGQLRDRELVTHVTRALDEELDNLDPTTRARLAAARNLALERADVRPRRPLAWTLAAVASAAVVVLAVTLFREGSQSLFVAGLRDLELLSSVDRFELYEDLDFYEWLEIELRG